LRLNRCGNSDRPLIEPRGAFENFELLESGWGKKDITYRIKNYPTKSRLSKDEVDYAITRAFSMWEEESKFRFEHKKSRNGKVDIELSFEPKEHGENEVFRDGEHGHAFEPRSGGDVHFNDEQTWTLDEYNGINLLFVAVHEIGHSMGLHHSRVSKAVMAPFYRGWDPFLRLTNDDIDGIKTITSDYK